MLRPRSWISLLFLLTLGRSCLSQKAAAPQVDVSSATQTLKLESCKPASERTGLEGCWILASKFLGKLPNQPVFWTLDIYPDRNSPQSAATGRSAVLDALGRVWQLTVSEKSATPSGGLRITQIGPLPIKADEE